MNLANSKFDSFSFPSEPRHSCECKKSLILCTFPHCRCHKMSEQQCNCIQVGNHCPVSLGEQSGTTIGNTHHVVNSHSHNAE